MARRGGWLACLALAALLAGPRAACAEEEEADPPESPARQKPEPLLGAEDLVRIQELLQKLSRAFLDGDAKAALDLFAPRNDRDLERHDRLRRILEREFETSRYVAFELLEPPLADDSFNETTHSVWVRWRCAYEDRNDRKQRSYFHNDVFTVMRLQDGSFRLVDSPLFDTLGQRRRLGLVADALLGAIALLAALTFWVWMGFEAFWLRPRSHRWRILVAALPFVGALAFFFARYLPEWQRRRAAPAG
ncbi:MAG: hypothetical protein M5U26_17705 [Planctomycetota bacterium]|nr:hypothetical protein [Planctomycetota bacterium]